MECAPGGGRIERKDLTLPAGLPENGSHDEAPVSQRCIQAASGGGVPRGRDTALTFQAPRYIAAGSIPIWVGKFEAGALDDDMQAADLIQEHEAKITALEPMVGRQALEIELLKGL